MKTPSILVLLFVFASLFGCQQKMIDELLYISKIKPLKTPFLFAENFITKDSVSEYGSIFNGAGSEFFYAIDSTGLSFIRYTELKGNHWIEPVTIISDSKYSFNDPFLSNDEQRHYYISDLPKDEADTLNDFDIWYSKRIENTWSKPIHAGNKINSDRNEYYVSFTKDGSMYFSSNKEAKESRLHNFDIYKSEFKNGEFLTPKKLNDSINSPRYEADVFISPDESYIIFCSAKETGFGRGDLYISFKDVDENWTKSINMGEKINSKNHELCPFVTKDGLYFFYTSNQDIYWVSTEIILELKNQLGL